MSVVGFPTTDLLNMPPKLTIKHSLNSTKRDVVGFRNSLDGVIGIVVPNSPNLDNVRFGQLGVSVLASDACSSFVSPIYRIIFVGSTEKVVRVATNRIVTVMTNAKTIFDWPKCYLKRVPVTVGKLSFYAGASITRCCYSSSPNPAPSKVGFMRRKWAFLVQFCHEYFRSGNFLWHNQKHPPNQLESPRSDSGNWVSRCKSWFSLTFCSHFQAGEKLSSFGLSVN